FLARDRSQLRKTVLVIDHYVPQPDRDAGSRTMDQFIGLFQKHGMSVKFWSDNLWHDPIYTPRLQQMGVETVYGPEHIENFEGWIAANGGCIDYVLLSRPHVAAKYVDA
ncbi:MAG TPA: glycosyl hydrolase family 1, partial [Stenotrophomonas sp.]|nr:glycosyl hydrolase family 1 [Stenotrophomonas sp.]